MCLFVKNIYIKTYVIADCMDELLNALLITYNDAF